MVYIYRRWKIASRAHLHVHNICRQHVKMICKLQQCQQRQLVIGLFYCYSFSDNYYLSYCVVTLKRQDIMQNCINSPTTIAHRIMGRGQSGAQQWQVDVHMANMKYVDIVCVNNISTQYNLQQFDYTYDSDEEWEDEAKISDAEELMSENNVCCTHTWIFHIIILYLLQSIDGDTASESGDEGFIVEHGYLSPDEGEGDDENVSVSVGISLFDFVQ
jgi:hypothetical protein